MAEIFEYDFDGITLYVHYETEPGDPTVGLFGTQVYMNGIYHKGEDIFELVSESTRNFLEERLMDYVSTL
jgi:hypothetical protein